MSDNIHKFSVDSLGPKVGDRPFDPFVELVLHNYSSSINGQIAISSRLISISEIDEFICLLKKDLDRLAEEAKTELEKLDSRTQN